MNDDDKRAWLEEHGSISFLGLSNFAEINGEWTSHGGAVLSVDGTIESDIRSKLYDKIKEDIYLECMYHEIP